METFKTIIAYALALILSPIFSGLTNLIFLPIFKISLFRKKLPSMLGTILMGVIGGFSAIWFGTIVFSWFDLQAGNLMLLFISIAFLKNDIYRIKTRQHRTFEYRHMFGNFLGIAIASLIFIWGYYLNQITTPLIIVAIIIYVFSYVSTNGNVEFWKLLEENPIEAYLFIENSTAWSIVELSENKDGLSKDFKWHGPFVHYFPMLGRKVKLYGKVGEYEKFQEEFVAKFR